MEKVSCLHDFIFLDAVFMWTVILENGSEKGSEMGAKHRKYPGFSGVLQQYIFFYEREFSQKILQDTNGIKYNR